MPLRRGKSPKGKYQGHDLDIPPCLRNRGAGEDQGRARVTRTAPLDAVSVAFFDPLRVKFAMRLRTKPSMWRRCSILTASPCLPQRSPRSSQPFPRMINRCCSRFSMRWQAQIAGRLPCNHKMLDKYVLRQSTADLDTPLVGAVRFCTLRRAHKTNILHASKIQKAKRRTAVEMINCSRSRDRSCLWLFCRNPEGRMVLFPCRCRARAVRLDRRRKG